MSPAEFEREFGEFLDSQTWVDWFTPLEVAQVGRTTRDSHGRLVRLEAPPRELWDHALQVISLAERIRDRLTAVDPAAVLVVTSGYRDPVYNAAVGGARNSLHTRFAALDLWCPQLGASPIADAAEADALSEYLGIGRYPGFTHVDVRGLIDEGYDAPKRW